MATAPAMMKCRAPDRSASAKAGWFASAWYMSGMAEKCVTGSVWSAMAASTSSGTNRVIVVTVPPK